jgi:hypothetical protein
MKTSTSSSGDPRIKPKQSVPSVNQWSSDEDPLTAFYERKVTYTKSAPT